METAELVLPIYIDIPPALQSANCTPDELQNEAFLTDQIETLWRIRQCHANAIKTDLKGMRSVDKTLGHLLFQMKSLLVKPGRNGGWSSWLADKKVARSSADRLVNRFAKSIAPKLPQGAVSEQEPTEADIGKLFGAV